MRDASRSSGVLCPLFSLPMGDGMGDLGSAAFHFIDRLHEAGFLYWALLPFSPLAHPYCPYSAISSMGIEPLYISIEQLRMAKLLTTKGGFTGPHHEIDYDQVVAFKKPLLHQAVSNFLNDAHHDWRDDYAHFIQSEPWVTDFALFVALKNHFAGLPFWQWPQPYRDRATDTLHGFAQEHQQMLEEQKVLQYFAHRQWREVKAYAYSKGISTFGDLPLYVAADSLDVWRYPEDFQLNADKTVSHVAGVPPDAFSDTGQKWGNPLYDWPRIQQANFSFWKKRLAYQHQQFDLLRIDHFLGLHRYWSIPADNDTATHGTYKPGPGQAFFNEMKNHFGPLSWVLEDLGAVTPGSAALQKATELPGMAVLQFGWNNPHQNPHHPTHHHVHSVCYLGTHDNETWQQWWDGQSDDIQNQVTQYVGNASIDVREKGLYLSLGSPSKLSIIPLPDLLRCDATGRINVPGVIEGNWKWRCTQEQLDQLDVVHLASLNQLFNRMPPQTP